ncbi:hypothetical protein PG996_006246, partial [Apiospora saccharicola]
GGNRKLVVGPNRPITACENCRTAKVRCNGQQDCQRCTARVLVCTYLTSGPASDRRSSARTVNDAHRVPSSSDASPPSSLSLSSMPETGPAMDQQTPSLSNIGAGTITTTAAPPYPDGARYSPGTDLAAKASADWAGAPGSHGINHFDWGGILDPTGQTFGSLAQFFPLDLNNLPPMIDTSTSHNQQSNSQDSNYNSLYSSKKDNNSGSSQDASPASVSPPSMGPQQTISQDDQQQAPRANLMLCVPKITSALQEKRLDEIFKVTGEVTKHCQDIVDCSTYEVRCSDLLLIMSVLQETRPCFDRIAKSNLSTNGSPSPSPSVVKLSFGGYEVASSSASFRALLVMDLVRRAGALVTAISTKGQSMIDELPEPCALARANIAYLEATISHFRSMLSCVTRYMDEAVGKEGAEFTV